MTHYEDTLSKETGHCDWCAQRIELGESITRVSSSPDQPGQAPADPRWFHSRCARQLAADAFW